MPSNSGAPDQEKLIDALVPVLEAAYGSVSRFETHISRVLVAGKYAFKFKKALRLPFLDFSTLDARHFYCREECRLNRRLAPGIYIDVVAVTGDVAHPVIGGTGPVREYAVRMHAFEQQALWSYRISHGLLGASDVDSLAARLACFHLDAPRAPPGRGWGSAPAIGATFEASLAELAELVMDDAGRAHLSAVRQWAAAQRHRLAALFELRKTQGMIRECHGDLHCGNVLTVDGQVQVFDCIEFSDELRWIDVLDDLAFIHMDLAFHARPELAARLLNRYLESTGDYAGLAVLAWYRVHRALVRAKVMLLHARQAGVGTDGLAYVRFAHACLRHRRVGILITHGCSGSGKSTLARYLVELLGAIQLRSDVERKRLHGLPAVGRAGAAEDSALYGDAATRRTYARLRALAGAVVEAGWPVIVDATFLAEAQRSSFRGLAAEMGVPFFIFDLRASRSTMTKRIESRQKAGRDPSDAGADTLERQLEHAEALEEAADVIAVDAEPEMTRERARQACAPVRAAFAVA